MSGFGEYLHQCRTAKKMSLEDVAKALHCTRQYIWLIESGKHRPRPELVDALAEVVDMDKTKAHVLNGTIRPDYYTVFVQFQDALYNAVTVIQKYGDAFIEALSNAMVK